MPIRPTEYVKRPYVRGGSLAELLQLQGRQQAESALRSGDIASQMWQNLGNSISNAVTSYAKERQEAPIRAQEAKARALQIQNAEGELADRAREREDSATLRSAQSSGLTPDQVKAQLTQLGRGDLVPLYEKANTDIEASRLTLKKLRDDVMTAERDHLGVLALNAKRANFDPLAMEWAFSEAERDGYDVSQLRQGYQTQPDAFPAIAEQLIGHSPAAQRQIAEEAARTRASQQDARANMETMERIASTNRDDRRQQEALEEQRQHNRAMEGKEKTPSYSWALDPKTGEEVFASAEEIRANGYQRAPSAASGMGAASIQLRNKRAAAALNSVETLKELAPERLPGPLGIAQGVVDVAKGYAGFHSNARQYQALVQPTAMQMAAAIQGAANLSDNERKAMADMLGSIHTMDYESQMALLDRARDLLKSGADVENVEGYWIPVERGAIKVAPGAAMPQPDDDGGEWKTVNGIRVRERRR